ncbi:MAG TPA: glycoside hydrolase family 2 TIM barrel-domain containing protein [Chitinophagaceae bacterium]|nr:glycoside hydrolase family 2 TIM barrel-domain containing protein [Chitinophagaceae bacterium]
MMHKTYFPVLLFVSLMLLGVSQSGWSQTIPEMRGHPDDISLAGIWHFKLDPLGLGIQQKGVLPDHVYAGTILLPGSTDQAGYGYRTGVMSSLRLTRLFAYKGAAWYAKTVYIPPAWKKKEVSLFLERAHWQTKVWVNGKPAGMRESLSVPQVYDITALMVAGQKNKIRIRVDNSMIYDIGYPHAISEETQTNWNGIIGKIELRASGKVHIGKVQVYPDVKKKQAKVKITIRNHTGQPVKGTLLLKAATINTETPQTVPSKDLSFSGSDSLIMVTTLLPMGEHPALWDEFHPALYHLGIEMAADDLYHDTDSVTFGMREFTTEGTQFLINGRPVFLRSDVNSAESPLTGYPAMDLKQWTHVFQVCKDYGLNAMRFHSWCPPEAAFEAADRLGFYLQVENADWRFNIGKDPATSNFLAADADRILEAYGNHPSFTMLCEGNELVGPKRDSFLTALIHHWQKEDPRHLYTGSSGYPVLPANEYEDLYGPRAQHWKEGLTGRLNREPYHTDFDYAKVVAKYKVPVVSHEVGQWCMYPGFDQISKYTGMLKPFNYALFRESLRRHHMLDEAKRFTMASGKFQVIQKKEELEALLRTPGLGGYELLELQDYPGQGTAPVGVVDIFWDPKPYVTAKEFRAFNASRVLLLSAPSFIFTNDMTFKATAELANYGETEMKNTVVHWSLRYPDGKIYEEGNLPKTRVAVGLRSLGKLSVSLDKVKTATRLILTLTVKGDTLTNHWDIWVYPQSLPELKPAGAFLIAHQWDEQVKNTLHKGGSVLLLGDTTKINSPIPPSFSGISWNTVWSGMPPDLLGILCNPAHPALKYFPTAYYSNWQWWDLVHHSKPLLLNDMPVSLRPIVQMIPDWNKNNKIGLIFEAKVGGGKLLMTSIDLVDQLQQRPVARQMLYSLEKYMNSADFDPKVTVSESQMAQLFKK